MRLIAVATLPFVLTAASEPDENPPPPSTFDNPAYSTPPERWETVEDASRTARVESILGGPDCVDRLHQAEEAGAQDAGPVTTGRFRREPASPEKPHMIYAVDRREGGCSLMVMKGNREDVRPLPLPANEGEMLMPAETDQ